MRVKNTTQRFELFVRDLQESFWAISRDERKKC